MLILPWEFWWSKLYGRLLPWEPLNPPSPVSPTSLESSSLSGTAGETVPPAGPSANFHLPPTLPKDTDFVIPPTNFLRPCCVQMRLNHFVFCNRIDDMPKISTIYQPRLEIYLFEKVYPLLQAALEELKRETWSKEVLSGGPLWFHSCRVWRQSIRQRDVLAEQVSWCSFSLELRLWTQLNHTENEQSFYFKYCFSSTKKNTILFFHRVNLDF